jgi:hypothetical protein
MSRYLSNYSLFLPYPAKFPIIQHINRRTLAHFYKIFVLIVFGLISNRVAAQPSFIINNQFATARENHLQKGDDSTSAMVIQQGGFKTSKTAILPVTLTTQFNSHHPYGYNDASFIPATGLQTQLTFGANVKAGPVKLQLQPELVYAANPSYPANGSYGYSSGKPYTKLYGGQSTLSISASAFSVGVSTANKWWGPGVTNALIMSNNAPGFANIYIKTHRPAKTPIGNFEFELIGGRLETDSTLPYENFHLKSSPNLRNSWRYINAYILSYNPKWLPGVYVGLIRSLQKYGPGIAEGKGSFTNKYIPIVTKTFQKKNDWGDDTLSIDQVASFFVRIVFPKSKSELYVEYGKNDYGERTRDYLMAPTHSVAHIVGFKKIVTLNNNRYLNLGIELTQMSQSPDAILRTAGNWYVHGQIGQGYTNYNQIMGVGSGFGANKQIVMGTWVSGNNRIGLFIEKTNRDPENRSIQWVDMVFGIAPQVTLKNIVLAAQFVFISSKNYAWEKDNNLSNFHAKLAVSYPINYAIKNTKN